MGDGGSPYGMGGVRAACGNLFLGVALVSGQRMLGEEGEETSREVAVACAFYYVLKFLSIFSRTVGCAISVHPTVGRSGVAYVVNFG